MQGINEDGSISPVGMKDDETFARYGIRVLKAQGIDTSELEKTLQKIEEKVALKYEETNPFYK